MHTENPFVKILPRGVCDRCFNTGIWLTPRNEVAVCPRVQMGEPHAVPNPAGFILRAKMKRLFGTFIHPQSFDLARILTFYTSAKPLRKASVFDLFWGDTELDEPRKLRKFHALIETLRNHWLLPVASRKNEPSGYWIAADLEDYKAWFYRSASAPVTQLSTLHRNAKANFPVFAEQLELDFWKDFGGDE